jgi:hypothetical protein
MSNYLEERRKQKLFGKPPEPTKRYRIPPKSEKRIAAEKEEKKSRVDEDSDMEQWHQARRKELTGTCQCGCGEPSSKSDDKWFRCSNAHILAKANFPSVRLHPRNHVERGHFSGCHAKMDTMGIEHWENFADWEDIKAKFLILEKLLTQKEKARKDFQKLKNLVDKN